MLREPTTPSVIPPDEQGVAGEFSAFYRSELAGQVQRAALILGSAAQANDIVHDAMIEVYRRWSTIDRPHAYLARSVLNGCRSAGRRSSVAHRALPRLVERDSIAPDDGVADLVAALPFNQRAAVVLRYFVGLNNIEIAEVMGCPPGSVGPWLTRALDTMRKALA